MGVVINPESEYGKELQKWEQFPKHKMDGEVLPAGNPYVFRMYPRMLYKAQTFRNGKVLTQAPPVSPFGWDDPNRYQQALLEAEAFTASCQRIVKSESEELIARGQGWAPSQADALELHEAQYAAMAREAAEAEYQAAKMSEKAQAEFRAAVDASPEHVSDVPAPKKRGPRTTVIVSPEN